MSGENPLARALGLSKNDAKRDTELFRMAQALCEMGSWRHDIVNDRFEWSDGLLTVLGVRPEAFDGRYQSLLDRAHPEDRERRARAFEAAEGGGLIDLEYRIIRDDGSERVVRERGRLVFAEDGRPAERFGAVMDVTDEAKSRARLHLLEQCIERLNDMLIITKADPIDPPGPEIVFVNEAFARSTGFSREEAVGKSPRILQGPGTSRAELDRIRTALQQGAPIRAELVNYTKAGAPYQVELEISPVFDRLHHISHFVAVERDVSERVAAAKKISESEARFRAVASATADVIWDWDLRTDEVWWNTGYETMFGHALASNPISSESWSRHIHPDDADRVLSGIRSAIESREPFWQDRYRFLHRDGHALKILDRGYLILDDAGAPTRFVGGMIDITEEERASEVLRLHTERLAQHVELMQDLTRAGGAQTESQLFDDIASYAARIVEADGALVAVARNASLLYISASGVMQGERGRLVPVEDSLSGPVLWKGQTRICDDVATLASGETDEARWKTLGVRAFMATPLPGIDDPLGVLSVFSKQTHAFDLEDLRTFEMFAQSAGALLQRRQLEERNRSAQRLQAVGQLTGGVAHDFNNLLTVILGNAETFSQKLAEDPALGPLAKMTLAAAERGAELTNRLLAFARRQPLDPQPTNVGKLLQAMQPLLRRTLGEPIEIDVKSVADLKPALVDAAQLESALLNLAINARDAMPSGGRLVYELSNFDVSHEKVSADLDLTPGAYVRISVTDTGVGMTREVMARAFDPFFTTKGPDRGSGLGLSMVFGFAKQSRGHVKIYSEVGLGTTVRLYLPSAAPASAGDETQASAEEPRRGGDEKILLVEDNDLVRGHVLSQLRALGYRVVEARNAREAIEATRRIKDFALLLTDIVMPGGMNGPELAAEIGKSGYPMKVLFMSGYAEAQAGQGAPLEPGAHFISKPFRQTDLDRKIRDVLGEV